MKKFLFVLGIFLLFPLFYILFPYSVWKHPLKIYCGNGIVKMVEAYKHMNNSLPSTLNELNISEKKRDGFFYETFNKDHYIIWFGTTLGESIQYNSIEGRWRFSASKN